VVHPKQLTNNSLKRAVAFRLLQSDARRGSGLAGTLACPDGVAVGVRRDERLPGIGGAAHELLTDEGRMRRWPDVMHTLSRRDTPVQFVGRRERCRTFPGRIRIVSPHVASPESGHSRFDIR
jgi:hypothetical protein